jgi:N-acetylneuraminic acid mutarotase
VIVGTDIWFVGGYVGDHPGPGTNHVWVYHTANDSWTRGPNLPVYRGAGAAALIGNTIYFTGGMDKTRTIDEGTTYALNLSSLSAGWVRKADLPNPRNHVAAAAIDGKFYVVGGQHSQEENQAAQTEVDVYDPATNKWTKLAPMPTYAGRSHITSATFAYNGKIITVGGETGFGAVTRTVMCYDPATNKWTQIGTLPAARSTVVAGIVNGKLVVTTGNGAADGGGTTTTWIGTLPAL